MENGAGDPVYTYKFIPGVSECSHGLLVAKMADIPEEIIRTAEGVLYQ